MKDYGALLIRLRAGAVLRDQWDAVLADIRSEDTAYVGEADPLYYIGPHTAFSFEGKVYDATRGFVVRDDGSGTMRLVEESGKADGSAMGDEPSALGMHMRRLRDFHLQEIQDALTAGNTADDLVTQLRGTVVALAQAVILLGKRMSRMEERLARVEAATESLPKDYVVSE